MSAATPPFGRRRSMESALRRVQPADLVVEHTNPRPALPNDQPGIIFTDHLDRAAQQHVEHATRPRARASPR
ncbi:hypothetical protein [Aureimonas phyllosphaerae]|uniref:Uncharacterized protein n=1 Tax=Aureimonas phyllosphaerae TaxID=1166078 RepID=A0A7W6BX69_9HYPH|nr:hypothetical protein [Aureimonas phyllosphaerae]MBB3937704.1 hypothetical protein [Aureimonas phyllosphaerae]MBB3961761.1 hypothetical protein [Aureimonas phyllosphaerae]SFF45239.1 hypothetical protein SAMN05216566_11442 [Aureimonas phyllosphaerae]